MVIQYVGTATTTDIVVVVVARCTG